MKKLVLTRIEWMGQKPLIFCLFDENRKPVNFWAFPQGSESLVNNIYIGKVETIAPNIHAAFVRLSKEMICYLPLKDASNPIYTRKPSKSPELRCGDELLVQIVKDAIKTKQPVLSANLSVHGTYCVITSGKQEIGVSKKIAKDKAAELRKAMNDMVEEEALFAGLPTDSGILLRTGAAAAELELLKSDIRSAIAGYRSMLERASHLSYGSLIQGGTPGYIDRIKSLSLDEVMIETDIPEVYEAIASYFPGSKQKGQLSLYTNEKLSLAAVSSINHHMEELTRRQVWLKSGANIIIEQLETLTFIDINSAKNAKGDAFAVNAEAAKEISSQLRLRNISGMILIDFINMSDEEENQQLIRILKESIKTDPVKCSYIDMTGLGLVELTRQKKEKSLKEVLQL